MHKMSHYTRVVLLCLFNNNRLFILDDVGDVAVLLLELLQLVELSHAVVFHPKSNPSPARAAGGQPRQGTPGLGQSAATGSPPYVPPVALQKTGHYLPEGISLGNIPGIFGIFSGIFCIIWAFPRFRGRRMSKKVFLCTSCWRSPRIWVEEKLPAIPGNPATRWPRPNTVH